MATIRAVRRLEDCVDGIVTREYEVDVPIDEADVRRLADGGTLVYRPDFPRPYYRIERDRFLFQGVVGRRSFRVTLEVALEEACDRDVSRRLAEGEGDG